MKKVFVTIMFLFPVLIFAQKMAWKHTGGPNGGIIGNMVINSGGEIYAGAYGFITPTFQFKYYAGLFKSTDNGNNWNEIETQFDPFRIYALYINKAGHILVGTDHQGRIYRSTDNGITWENNNSGYNTGECWAFGESNDGILFAGSGEGQVYRSTNYGDSWVLSANLPSLVFATDTNNVVYCGTFNGLYKSTDNGISWQPDNFLINIELSSIIIDEDNNIFCSTGYYSNSSGVYYSTDGGNSWVHLGLDGYTVLSLALDSEGTLYAGTKQDGLFSTTDMGQTWSRHQNGIEGIEVFRLKINSQDHIFIGSENEGVYRSVDGGETFTQVGLPISHIQNIDFSPDKNFIFASTPSGVQRYNRITGTWENKGLREVEAVSVSPSGYLYAATYMDGLYYSSDYGDSWERIITLDDYRYNFLAATDSFLIDAVFPVLRISTDSGVSWTSTNIGISTNHSIEFNKIDKIIFIHGFLNESKIFYSSNFGQFFFEIITPSSISSKKGISINSNGSLFFTSRQGNNQIHGIYISTYPYEGWIKLYTGRTYSIFVDEIDKIYSSVSTGIMMSSDNGDNWEFIFTENPSRAFAHDLKIDGDILFIATNSYGLYELQIPTSIDDNYNLFIDYQLYQNYPNPFNPGTFISWQSPVGGLQSLKVYDVLGREVATLVNEYKEAGTHSVEFNAEGLTSGVYFYRLNAGSFSETKKMILLK